MKDKNVWEPENHTTATLAKEGEETSPFHLGHKHSLQQDSIGVRFSVLQCTGETVSAKIYVRVKKRKQWKKTMFNNTYN